MLNLTIGELDLLMSILESNIDAMDRPKDIAAIHAKLLNERSELVREEREKAEADAIDAGELDPILTDEEHAIAERRRMRLKEGGHGGWGTWYESPEEGDFGDRLTKK